MFFAKTSVAYGTGITEEQAVAGVCHYHIENDYAPRGKMEITIVEFRAEDFYGNSDATFFRYEEQDWPEDQTTYTVEPDGVERFAELFEELKRQLSVADSDGGDWRVDYGDENINYVVESEDGVVVDICDHWDQAKESRQTANEDWDDGKKYWINEVEGEINLTLGEV